MATPEKNKPDDVLDELPIQKTSPLVYVGIAVVVLVLGGVGAYTVFGRGEEKPKADMAAALHSARMAAAEEKAKQKEKEEHLELAAKAWAAASEKERAAAAASAAAAATAEGEEPKGDGPVGGGAPAGGSPPKPKGPSGNELDELDKLGSAVNSELGK